MIEGYEQFYNGVIRQVKPEPYVYDEKYVKDRYDSYGEKCDMLSYLRLGYIMGAIKKFPSSVLDIGYGNGSFLKICEEANIDTYGTDISNYKLKYGKFVPSDKIYNKSYDLITMFDSMEHMHDLKFLLDLNCNYLCISVPFCHYNEIYESNALAGEEYFTNWKHRRPDEHIWHFDDKSLIAFMKDHDFIKISTSTIEDMIRLPSDNFPNILTGVFKRR